MLPSELVLAIVETISEQDPLFRSTLLALTRAFPGLPANHLLFQRIELDHAEQVVHLTRRLVQSDWRDIVNYTREFKWHGWMVDADLIVNILAKFPMLRSLDLWIGTHFSPEHLTDIFQKPRPGLEYLSLRFRPYVQKANYLPFLKGSFFDSTLLCLAKWPHTTLPTLSIVQDAIPESDTPTKFAQPIVFHTLDSSLPIFSQSAVLSNLTSLRFCLPARPMAIPLTNSPRSLPSLEMLDLSTCTVFGAELTDTLLVNLSRLKHVILDNGALLRGEFHADDWAVLGKGCALAGVKRARDRERKLKQARLAATVETAPRQPRAAKAGRKGLSTAKISLRPSPPREDATPHVSSTLSPLLLARIRVWPAVPSLRSFATTLAPSVSPTKHAEIRENFSRGWREGLAQLIQTRSRLYQAYRMGSATVMRFAQEPLGSSDQDNELNGLVEVIEWDENVEEMGVPVLCFAGRHNAAAHEAGCAHSFAWEAWKE
ncbi:F-box domain-containing protein [Mycena indigotica]|uniref:F-box domain-containing protein n=1 Tax=Mycena indigotica TaxID=2126181 RepID=A0A8H6SYY3_9AGAR|nr:F-box domain-containing protein [Mycena indigotica]KAF7307342.1 F-box domain-containing protein [Mycena indigotica]